MTLEPFTIHLCNVIADHLRQHGPFEPHRLPMEEMEYTTLPQVAEKLVGCWHPANGQVREAGMRTGAT